MPPSAPSSPLPIARLILTVRADAPLQLPPYAGSALRGAFGQALLRLAPLPHRDRQPCTLQANCLYCQIFAPPTPQNHTLQKLSGVPAPYVIEPPMSSQPQRIPAGQTFEFGLVLIGKALQHLPGIVLAFEHALRHGLSDRHTPCTLLAVRQENASAPLWQAGQSQAADPGRIETTLPPAANLEQNASLRLRTPLRIQHQNRPAGRDDLNARTLLITLARRYQFLLDAYLGPQAPQQDFAAISAQGQAIALDAAELRWLNVDRYSSRQRQSIKLSGLLGTLRLHGELAPFSQLLHLGQWLHVGKETVFGLGGYALQIPAAQPL